MSSNSFLAELHRERMERQHPALKAKTEEFECPVCYTKDKSESGVVEPTCKHSICINCYSTILLKDKKESSCPCCRKKYLKAAVPQADLEEDTNYIMPVLISLDNLININIPRYTNDIFQINTYNRIMR